MNALSSSEPLVDRLYALLDALSSPVLREFLAHWPEEPPARRIVEAAGQPVLGQLAKIADEAPEFSAGLIRELCRLAPSLNWRQTYRSGEVSAAFLDNYAWSEFLGLTGPVPSRHLAVGLLLLGPDTDYPQHRHEAQEIYVPLSGTAWWWKESADWCEQPPGAVIHHRHHEAHAMRTGASPLLAAYLWQATDLGQKARLVDKSYTRPPLRPDTRS